MKDPSRSSNTSNIMNNEVILTSQFNNDENPFAEYMWMENEEEFNRQSNEEEPLFLGEGQTAAKEVEEELWEEEFIEQCFQEMLEEEEHEWFIPARDLPQAISQLQDQLSLLGLGDGCLLDDLVINSNLNPNAAEFVPGIKH